MARRSYVTGGGFASRLRVFVPKTPVTPPTPTPTPTPTVVRRRRVYEAKLVHRGRDGTIKHRAITDFLAVQCQRVVNQPGLLSFTFLGNDNLVQTFEKYDQVEFWWRNLGLGVDWHREFIGFFMDELWRDNQDNITEWTAYCPGEMMLLELVDIAYASGEANLTLFSAVPAETVAKTLVQYNTTEDAVTGNGRFLDADLDALMGFDVRIATDQGRGNDISKGFENANLLNAIADNVAPLAGGDFALTRSDLATDELYWTFEFYPGQLGEDKTTGSKKVEFSKLRDNIANVRWQVKRRGVPTVGVVGGRGRADARDYQVVYASDYVATDHIETFINAAGDDAAALQNIGESELKRRGNQSLLEFEIWQTPTVFYGPEVPGKITYTLGDLCNVVYPAGVERRKVTGVTITVEYPSGNDPAVQFAVQTETA